VQVLDIEAVSDDMQVFTVADGTCFVYCIHLDGSERHVTNDVRILVINPSPDLKKIRVNITMIY
jgi:hypothetical protein